MSNSARPSLATPRPPDPFVDLSGRQLGDYRLLRRLGRGGMADVYLAEQLSLGRKVAFKALRSGLAEDASYVRRFLHEARSAASLVHANIVQIHEVGRVDGVHYIAQEYVPGQNLKQILSRRGPLQAAQAVAIMRQVASALLRAAEQGVIHRDIKPENVLVTENGEVKVADFGLARAAHDGAAMNLTQAGVTMGTPLYMSPEQVQGGELDPRSDLYSLGVTAYHMLAGRTPFVGETPLAIAVQHVNSPPQRLEDLRPDLPVALCVVVHRLLAKKPQDRYENARELLLDLRSLRLEPDDNWAHGLSDTDSDELATLAASPLAATQRLDALMKSSEQSGHPLGGGRGALAALVSLFALAVAFATGVGAAWLNRPEPLLYVAPQERPAIPQLDSPRQQYQTARRMNTPEWLESVAAHFPPSESAENEYYARRAQQRLAEWHFDRQHYAEAMEIFEDLASIETEEEFRAFGLAGQVIIHWRRGEQQTAIQKYRELVPIKGLLETSPRWRDAIGRFEQQIASQEQAPTDDS